MFLLMESVKKTVDCLVLIRQICTILNHNYQISSVVSNECIAPVTLGRIAVYTNILSGGEITIPVRQKIYAFQECICDEHCLTRMHFAIITGHKKNIKRTFTNTINFLYVRAIWPRVTGLFTV